MTKSYLKQLHISYLRGAVQPFEIKFEKGKPLTVIYGENGSGKTTICDAIEFVCEGQVGSLNNRGLEGKPDKYWPAVGRKSTDILVKLETDLHTFTATYMKPNVLVQPTEGVPKPEILRRAQILHILEAKAADRYAAIKSFIDIAAVENAEANAKALLADLMQKQASIQERLGENNQALGQIWERQGKQGKNAISWARSELTKPADDHSAMISIIGQLRAAFFAISSFPSKINAGWTKLNEAKTNFFNIETQLKDKISDLATGTSEVIEILTKAQTFLAIEQNPALCPLCESDTKVAGVGARIENRLAQFKDIRDAQGKLSAAKKNAENSQFLMDAIKSELSQAIHAFQVKCSTIDTTSILTLPENPPPEDFDQLALWVQQCAELAITWQATEN